MPDIAKVFMSGRSQAVRIPKKYRLDAKEVEISREGEAIVLRPRRGDRFERLMATLEQFDAERFAECFPNGREQPEEQERPALDKLFP